MINLSKESELLGPIFSLKNNLIYQNIALSDKNWFKTGGPARFFCEPKNNIDFQNALKFANFHNLEVFILGQGANVLINDDGFNGLVIRPALNDISIMEYDGDNSLVKAGAGVEFQKLIDYCLENNLSGLEEFSGIPGTVGGSIFINIHYFEYLLSQFLVSAEIIEKSTGKIISVNNNWFNFGYNYSNLHKKNHYVLSAKFKLKKMSIEEKFYAKGRSYEIIRHRAKRYPTSGTCGSFFRNFFEDEITLQQNKKKIIYVAYYLDKIGIKGTLAVGNAVVSYQHANMIVNTGNAKTKDIIALAKKMQELVYKNFKIIPQPECQLIGFNEYPLLKY